MRGIDQELRGNAADIDAGAAQIAVLDDRDPGPVARRDPGGADAPRSRADDEIVEIVAARQCSLLSPAGTDAGPAGLHPPGGSAAPDTTPMWRAKIGRAHV